MKLWQINVKIRKFSNWIRWPLVTRARFELNAENYEAELKATEDIANNYLRMLNAGEYGELRRQLTQANYDRDLAQLQLKDREKAITDLQSRVDALTAELEETRKQLAVAEKNDHRDADTGRYEKAE